MNSNKKRNKDDNEREEDLCFKFFRGKNLLEYFHTENERATNEWVNGNINLPCKYFQEVNDGSCRSILKMNDVFFTKNKYVSSRNLNKLCNEEDELEEEREQGSTNISQEITAIELSQSNYPWKVFQDISRNRNVSFEEYNLEVPPYMEDIWWKKYLYLAKPKTKIEVYFDVDNSFREKFIDPLIRDEPEFQIYFQGQKFFDPEDDSKEMKMKMKLTKDEKNPKLLKVWYSHTKFDQSGHTWSSQLKTVFTSYLERLEILTKTPKSWKTKAQSYLYLYLTKFQDNLSVAVPLDRLIPWVMKKEKVNPNKKLLSIMQREWKMIVYPDKDVAYHNFHRLYRASFDDTSSQTDRSEIGSPLQQENQSIPSQRNSYQPSPMLMTAPHPSNRSTPSVLSTQSSQSNLTQKKRKATNRSTAIIQSPCNENNDSYIQENDSQEFYQEEEEMVRNEKQKGIEKDHHNDDTDEILIIKRKKTVSSENSSSNSSSRQTINPQSPFQIFLQKKSTSTPNPSSFTTINNILSPDTNYIYTPVLTPNSSTYHSNSESEIPKFIPKGFPFIRDLDHQTTNQ